MKKKLRFLYIILALSLILSGIMVLVGISNSRTAEAAAATATAQLMAQQTSEATQAVTQTPGSATTVTPDESTDPAIYSSLEAVAVTETESPTQKPEATDGETVNTGSTIASTDAAVINGVSSNNGTNRDLMPVAGQPVLLAEDAAGTQGNDSTIYTIENTQFGIDSTGANARATTDGINAALKWAKDQGYKTVKFTTGTYMVQCNWRNRYIAPTDGILVPSDLTLDLGDSTFKMEPNSYPEYTIFGIVSQSNVTIKNGKLVGDSDNHVFAYSSDSPTHEFGFGICISASSNVVIKNVTISKMTGDGIIIEGSYSKLSDGGSVSTGIKILDCNISDCRRQGISVIGANNSEIAGNKIYDINGVDPQYGIDLESELDYTLEKLKIHDNTIYNCSGGAISCNKGNDYDVYNNVCSGNVLAVFSSNIRIYGNTIKDSFIEVMTGASNITVENNILEGNSWVQIDK